MAKLLEVWAKEGGERAAFALVRWIARKTGLNLRLTDDVPRDAVRARKQGGSGAVRDAERGIVCRLCFPAGTLVATPGGERTIEVLHMGDTVLAEDTQDGTVAAEPVQTVLRDPASDLLAVDLSDGSAITATADHPFWVDGGLFLHGSGWLEAGQLQPGDRLRTASGHGVVVAGLRRHVGKAVVYTLTVARDHTFFVGTAHVLVHNCGLVPYGSTELSRTVQAAHLTSRHKEGVSSDDDPAETLRRPRRFP